MLNIIERFLIHFFASGGILLATVFALRTAYRRTRYSWLPSTLFTQCLVLSICIFAAAALREAYDVSQGGTLIKSVFDYVSWAGGCGCSAWAIIRINKL